MELVIDQWKGRLFSWVVVILETVLINVFKLIVCILLCSDVNIPSVWHSRYFDIFSYLSWAVGSCILLVCLSVGDVRLFLGRWLLFSLVPVKYTLGTVLLNDLRKELRKKLKLEYTIKSFNYIQQHFIVQASLLFYWTMYSFWHDQWYKMYKDRKWLRNFTICVSALVKQYPRTIV